MYTIYIGHNYPAKYEADDVIAALNTNASIINNPAEADFFVFPVNYEKLYGYTEHENNHFNFLKAEVEKLRKQLAEMTEFAQLYQKKILLFYFYDPVKKIEVPNAVIFRTSLLKSKRDKNEFAMPAYGKDLRSIQTPDTNNLYLRKTEKPKVGFRGQSAPLKLPAKLSLKRIINKTLSAIGFKRVFNLHYNFGYLARRDAILSCQKNKGIDTDITLTSMEQSWDPENGKIPFVNNVFSNQYNICVSGHGNYSFRLYEIMSAGRIPVFINTDCVLPFEEFFDWKKHVVWVEEKDANQTDKIILDFHQSINNDDFIKLQKNNREIWEEQLSKKGFFTSLPKYFPLLEQF